MIHSVDTRTFDHLSFQEIEFDPPWDVAEARVGVDPGTANMGIAILVPDMAGLLYQIKMERDKDPMVRLRRTHEALSRIFYYFDVPNCIQRVIIENASFGDHFRQVELAEQRAGIGLWFRDRYDCPVYFVSPTSIYKWVFGNSKTKAGNEWPQYPKDAASALAAAYFPLDKLKEKV